MGWLYALPAFAIYGAFLLFPLGRAVQISLYDWDGLTLGTWVGFDNYVEVFGSEALRAAFGHALILMLFFAVLPLCVGLLLAALLNRAKVRGLGFFRTVVFLPQVVAMVVVAVAWRRIYAPDGTLNSALDLVMLGGMAQIDKSLYEAARLDGAGPIREFFSITLPAVRGEISVALTLTVIAALKTFDLVYVTTKGGPGNQTSVPSYEVYHRAFETGQVGLACAIGVTLTAVVFFISYLITRFVEPSRS